MKMRKWEKVDIRLTDEERRSFRGAIIVFAIAEALVLVPYVLYTLLR